jgi:hypothetical protein
MPPDPRPTIHGRTIEAEKRKAGKRQKRGEREVLVAKTYETIEY